MVNPGKDKELKAHIRGELERGVKVPDIAEYTKVPKNTIRRWKRNLERHGSMDAPPIGNAGGHKSLTSEQEHYLLGYVHGRPDAYLTEMQRVLKEAFNHDVSLPTISRTLKLKGCMKGFNKTRQIRTAVNFAGKEPANGLHASDHTAQPTPALTDTRNMENGTATVDFEEDLGHHLEHHLQQSTPNEENPHITQSRPDQDATPLQFGDSGSAQEQIQSLDQHPSSAMTGADSIHSTLTDLNSVIDPSLG